MAPIMPKKYPTNSDACNGNLILRADDTEAVIKDRLNIYKTKTAPLEDYYKQKGVYIEFEPKRGVKDYPEIKAKLDEFIKSKKH